MAQFLQIVLINLAVSCDNVGVIALATRDLPERTAAVVRRVGIGLSLVLKILFVAVVGTLLQVPWLHIRVIGGVMLLYVTFQMVGAHSQDAPEKAARQRDAQGGVLSAIVAIILADISMSLDNVVAILGVVSAEGDSLDLRAYLLVIGGLVICMPLLLWFSGAIAKLMEQFPILTYLCAGYLVYTANNIILEDESIRLFCVAAHFTFARPAAVLCGVLMALYGWIGSRRRQTKRARRGILSLYLLVLASSMLMVGGFSFLSSAHFDGFDHPVQRLMIEKLQSGVNAVYLLGIESEMLGFCMAVLAGMRARSRDRNARGIFLQNMKGMGVFILLYLTVVTAGFSYTFGIGDLQIVIWLTHVLLMAALLLTYPAVFSLIAAVTRSRPLSVSLGLFYLLLESAVTAICSIYSGWLPLAGLLPKYYLSSYVLQPLTTVLGLRILLVSALWIGLCYVGVRWIEDRRKVNNMQPLVG